MAFQIAYVFEFIDKYSKVANDLLKKVKHIDKAVLGSASKFEKLGATGSKAFAKVKRASVEAESRMGKLENQTRQATMGMKAMGAVAGNLKFRIASLVVTMGMTGFGMKQLVDKGKSIEKSFTIMSALTGLAGKELKFLEKKAFEFSRVMGIPMEDVATGFKRVAGLKPELLENVEALAELTKWTLILDAPMEQIEKVSRALVVSLNVYGKTAASAAEHANILAAAQRKGSAEVIDMALSFLKTGAVAETAAVPFIKLISAIQALGRAGILKQMSGTSLRTIMIRVAKQSKASGDTFIGVLKRMRDEVFSVEGKLERIAVASEFFGVRQAAAGLILLKNIRFMEEFEQSIKGTNIAMDTAKTVLTTYERQVAKIWALWDREMKTVFEEAGPDLLRLHRQWVAFITQLSMAPPGGLGKLIGLFAELANDIMEVVNLALVLWNILTSPFTLFEGWDAFMNRWEKIGDIWNMMYAGTPLAFGPPPTLDAISEPGAGTPGAAGRVQVDLNIKDKGGMVENTAATAEGDVDFNLAPNFAY